MGSQFKDKSALIVDIKKKPSIVQKRYLMRGVNEPGGKLPLFDKDGQRIKKQTIRSCIKNGWCVEWCRNPIKPNWLVCKLTDAGRYAVRTQSGNSE